MSLIQRHLADPITQAMASFPAVLVTGPRQVGKSTLLQMVGRGYEYVSFDDPLQLRQAKEDPELFLQTRQPRLILDEIQYVPELFSYLKLRIDRMRMSALMEDHSQECLFLLSGSQTYHLMANVSESLAGRFAILPMQGISYREKAGVSCKLPFVPEATYLKERGKAGGTASELWAMIHRGSMPRLVASEDDWERFYAGYVATYLERDVNQLAQVADRGDFVRMMVAVAARSGELVNYQSIAQEVGCSPTTIKRWLQILETSGIVFLLQPYHNNHLKRVIKTPKLYFMDTGLMAWLTRWITPETMMRGAKAGQFFETWVVAEIVKSYLNAGKSVRDIYYYRDADQREIDLVVERGRVVHPMEIKLTAKPTARMGQAFRLLEPVAQKGDMKIGEGVVINLYPEIIHLKENIRSLPAWYL